ncbi:MAG: hypothetical protein PHZ00_03380 [Candidatus Peribacteraceae bacterium]|nr:hypothetical protein [Candidatus Peribacteraceae bacterium]
MQNIESRFSHSSSIASEVPERWNRYSPPFFPPLQFSHPPEWERSIPERVSQVTFNRGRSTKNLVSVSVSQHSSSDLGLQLSSYDFFRGPFRNHQYRKFTNANGVEIYASLDNDDTYDDAFAFVSGRTVYLKNGVNDLTGADDITFMQLLQSIQTTGARHLATTPFTSPVCSTYVDDFSDLYWSYRYSQHAKPHEVYIVGSVCKITPVKTLVSFADYPTSRSFVIFDANDDFLQENTSFSCSTIGDFEPPRIESIVDGTASAFCFGWDAGWTSFDAFDMQVDSLMFSVMPEESSAYHELRKRLSQRFNIEFLENGKQIEP